MRLSYIFNKKKTTERNHLDLCRLLFIVSKDMILLNHEFQHKRYYRNRSWVFFFLLSFLLTFKKYKYFLIVYSHSWHVYRKDLNKNDQRQIYNLPWFSDKVESKMTQRKPSASSWVELLSISPNFYFSSQRVS